MVPNRLVVKVKIQNKMVNFVNPRLFNKIQPYIIKRYHIVARLRENSETGTQYLTIKEEIKVMKDHHQLLV